MIELACRECAYDGTYRIDTSAKCSGNIQKKASAIAAALAATRHDADADDADDGNPLMSGPEPVFAKLVEMWCHTKVQHCTHLRGLP